MIMDPVFLLKSIQHIKVLAEESVKTAQTGKIYFKTTGLLCKKNLLLISATLKALKPEDGSQ